MIYESFLRHSTFWQSYAAINESLVSILQEIISQLVKYDILIEFHHSVDLPGSALAKGFPGMPGGGAPKENPPPKV